MANYTFYCEIEVFNTDKPTVYSFVSDSQSTLGFKGAIRLSEKVWRQGPKGGVKVIKSKDNSIRSYYVTNNDNEMKKFMWVKLQAQPFN